MEIVAGNAGTLRQELMERLVRYRHKVFVETLGWPLQTSGCREVDQFDRTDTVYLVARDGGGNVVGTARILPTDKPFLLGDVFPQLMGDEPMPRAADVWEISRFAAMDFAAEAALPEPQFSSPVAIDLLRKAIAMAATAGVKRLITVSPMGVERILRRAGFVAHRAGPPRVVDGDMLFACWIEVQGAAGMA